MQSKLTTIVLTSTRKVFVYLFRGLVVRKSEVLLSIKVVKPLSQGFIKIDRVG